MVSRPGSGRCNERLSGGRVLRLRAASSSPLRASQRSCEGVPGSPTVGEPATIRHSCTHGWLAMSVPPFLHDRHAVPALFGTAELSYLGARNGSIRFASRDLLPVARPASDRAIMGRSSPFRDPPRRGSRPRARLSSPAPGRSRTNLLPVRPDLSSARRTSHRRAFRFRARPSRDRSSKGVEASAARAGFAGADLVRSSTPAIEAARSLIAGRGNGNPDREGDRAAPMPDGASYSADEIRSRPNFIRVTARPADTPSGLAFAEDVSNGSKRLRLGITPSGRRRRARTTSRAA